jgi:glutamate dehydrogenase
MAQDDTPALAGIVGDVETVLRRGASGSAADHLALFARLLLDSAGAEAVEGLSSDTLAAFVREAYAFIAVKPAQGPAVRVAAAELPAGAVTRRLATIQTLNSDMPFLVDSVMGEVQAQGLNPLLVVHPIFRTQRDTGGRLQAIASPGEQGSAAGRQESYIAVLLDPIDEMLARALETTLPAVLSEVRAAVEDWRPMLGRVQEAIAAHERAAHGGGMSPTIAEALTFCRWLHDGHFTFLGARTLARSGGGLVPEAGSALGLLRGKDNVTLVGPDADETASGPVIFAKSPLLSRVHRRAAMDTVVIALPDRGRLELVGLLTSSAYTQSPREIPLLRQKVAAVVARSGHPPGSHAAKALINVLETFPRDELFLTGEVQLATWADAVLDLELRPRVRLLARPHTALDPGAGTMPVSAIVYVPRDRYSTRTRERIGQILAEAWDGRVTGFTPFFPEGPLVRIHFNLAAAGNAQVDPRAVERRIADVVRSWEDNLADRLAGQGDAAPALYARYRQAFSDGYRGLVTPTRAIEDIARIESLSSGKPAAIDFYLQPGEPAQRMHAAVYRLGAPIPLSERVPMLENLGFSAIDERTFEVAPGGASVVALHDMLLETADRAPVALSGLDARLEEAVLAVLAGEADNDPFNRLVLVAGLTWREAAVLRAYAAYVRQMPAPFGPRYIADTLARHPDLAGALISLFRTRLDPDMGSDMAARRQREGEVRAGIEAALAGVASLDEDRILRLLLTLISATLRTNAFQPPPGAMPAALAFKLDSRKLDALPEPRPFREIWVYSPRIEGVHLRFAPIARGGIRWSDRAQDFRTEVLGLAKAQQVKNAVIVPQGAKGGFLPKRLPRSGTREEIAREGLAAYRIFIGALLDVTDNLAQGTVVPPPRVVRHDGDDPYFVVAADKGTATFSDTANGIALERGFWLGDAFASGGSAGYDHKGMGITARGAFECIRRHFREMDHDIDATPFSVVGVGDMSGDVFGNGMLLSKQTRLIAAFDHRDIFVDPDPDVATSFAERARMFALPRSSWQDYDKKALSEGGGIFPRTAKSIATTPEMRTALAIEATELTPAELIRAILKAPCDLLWLGGIGTYVKASDETDEQVGDRANDGVRITAAEARAKAIGEGANLGVTQRGRIEYARNGGRIDTDFIDNSAGVNTSDQEVNIKIALAPAVAAGRLTPAHRLALLKEMTDDVAVGALRNNYQQSLALSLAERRGAADLGYLQRLMQVLEGRGVLDRRREALPSNAEIAQRQAAGRGLTRPELAVLLSNAKIVLIEDLLATDVPDRPALRALIGIYFPRVLSERYCADVAAHRLRREIVATLLTNAMINRGGPAYVVRLTDETGRPLPDIAGAFLVARSAYGLPEIWQQIDALDNKVKGAVQLDLYARVQDVLLTTTRWLARKGAAGPAEAEIAEVVGRLRSGDLAGAIPKEQAERIAAETARLGEAGVPEPLRTMLATLELQADAPAIAALARGEKRGLDEAARALFAASGLVRLDALAARAGEITIRDHFDRLAVDGALARIRATAERLARHTLANGAGEPAEAGRAVRTIVDGALGPGMLTTSRLTVAAERIREIADG